MGTFTHSLVVKVQQRPTKILTVKENRELLESSLQNWMAMILSLAKPLWVRPWRHIQKTDTSSYCDPFCFLIHCGLGCLDWPVVRFSQLTQSSQCCQFWRQRFFFYIFEGHKSFCGATDTPVLDFWWGLLWVVTTAKKGYLQWGLFWWSLDRSFMFISLSFPGVSF